MLNVEWIVFTAIKRSNSRQRATMPSTMENRQCLKALKSPFHLLEIGIDWFCTWHKNRRSSRYMKWLSLLEHFFIVYWNMTKKTNVFHLLNQCISIILSLTQSGWCVCVCVRDAWHLLCAMLLNLDFSYLVLLFCFFSSVFSHHFNSRIHKKINVPDKNQPLFFGLFPYPLT